MLLKVNAFVFKFGAIIITVPPLIKNIMSTLVVSRKTGRTKLTSLSIFTVIVCIVRKFTKCPLASVILGGRKGQLLRRCQDKGLTCGARNVTDRRATTTTRTTPGPRLGLFQGVPRGCGASFFGFLELTTMSCLTCLASALLTPITDIDPFMLYLLFKIVTADVNFLRGRMLRGTGNFNFTVVTLVLFVFSNLGRTAPKVVLRVVCPLTKDVVLNMVKVCVFSFVTKGVLGIDGRVTFTISLATLCNFPTSCVVAGRIVGSLARSRGRERVLADGVLPPVLIKKFVAIAVISIMLTKVFIKLLWRESWVRVDRIRAKGGIGLRGMRKQVRGRVSALDACATAPNGKAAQLACDRRSLLTQRCVGKGVGRTNLTIHRSKLKGVFKGLRKSLGSTPDILVNSRFSSIPGKKSCSKPTKIMTKLRITTLFARGKLAPGCPLRIVTLVRRRNSEFNNNLVNSHKVINLLTRRSFGSLGSGSNVAAIRTVGGVKLSPSLPGAESRRSMGACLRLRVRRKPVLRRGGVPVKMIRTVINLARLRMAMGKRTKRTKAAPVSEQSSTLITTTKVVTRFPRLTTTRKRKAMMAAKRVRICPGKTGMVPSRAIFSMSVHSNGRRRIRGIVRGMGRLTKVCHSDKMRVAIRRLLCVRPGRVGGRVIDLLGGGDDRLNFASYPVGDNTKRSTVIFTSCADAKVLFVPDGGNLDRYPRR